MIENRILTALNACLRADYTAKQVCIYHKSFDPVNYKYDHSMFVDGRSIEMQEEVRSNRSFFKIVLDA